MVAGNKEEYKEQATDCETLTADAFHDGMSQSCDQGLCPAQCAFREAVADPRSIHGSPHETRLFESLEVLRDRRLRQREFKDDLTTKTLPPPGEDAENLHTGRMSKSLCKYS